MCFKSSHLRCEIRLNRSVKGIKRIIKLDLVKTRTGEMKAFENRTVQVRTVFFWCYFSFHSFSHPFLEIV